MRPNGIVGLAIGLVVFGLLVFAAIKVERRVGLNV